MRATPAGTVVEATDPALLVQVTGRPEPAPVASEAAERLTAALDSLKN